MSFNPNQPYGVISDTSPVLYIQSGVIYRSDTFTSVSSVSGFLFTGSPPATNISTYLGVVPLQSQTIAQLTANYPASGYLGFTAYTTDQGLVFSNGTAWLLTTDTSINAGLLTGSSNASANATAIMSAGTGGNITVKLPAGTFYVGPMVFTSGGVQIQGEGIYATTLIFVPTGNAAAAPGYGTTDPGTCFQFCTNAGQAIIYNCSLKRLTISTTDTTFSKVAVRLCETSQFVLEDIVASTFHGQNSVGLQTMGHELASINRCNFNACVPIRLSRGLKAYGTTLAGVAIAGTAGQFTCTSSSLVAGQMMTISGTFGGTGSITGYVDPTTYIVSATNGTTTFTLTTITGGALTTTVGTPTGLTYTTGIVYSMDHFHFSDLYLGIDGAFQPSTLQSTCVLMDDGLFVSNLSFDGHQAWVGGKYGFYCSNTIFPGSINYNWSFKNIRKEQGVSTPNTMFYYSNTSSGTYNLRQLYFENCYNADQYTGWYLDGLYFATMVNCMSPVAFGGSFVVQGGVNMLGMDWRAMWCNSGDTVSLANTGLYGPMNATYYTGYKLPFSGSWVQGGFPITNPGVDIITGPVTGFSYVIANTTNVKIVDPAGTLANGTFTLPSAPNNEQEIFIMSTTNITSLTVSASQTIKGIAATSLAGGVGIRYIWSAANTAWYRLQ
jgi:hypothetical protein